MNNTSIEEATSYFKHLLIEQKDRIKTIQENTDWVNYNEKKQIKIGICWGDGIGDEVFIYHSNATPPGIVGLASIASAPYPDHFAWNDESNYFDAKSTPEKPRWFMVDVKFKKKFNQMISLEILKSDTNLIDMMVTKKGSRLSIQPVSDTEFDYIIKKFVVIELQSFGLSLSHPVSPKDNLL